MMCVRKELLQTLAQGLSTNTIRFGSKISAIHQRQDNSSIATLDDGSQILPKDATVAKWLGFGSPKMVGRSTFLGLGSFPQGHHFEPTTVQIWGDGLRGASLLAMKGTLSGS
ncbi:hypothetical protein SUGI_0076220 [Cryptomeria japonica]|nr:hypothetical protein SUGI_0076220 [Cryptomeria japonica]